MLLSAFGRRLVPHIGVVEDYVSDLPYNPPLLLDGLYEEPLGDLPEDEDDA
jgi:hypothetical protein